jgi:hypothetical protein
MVDDGHVHVSICCQRHKTFVTSPTGNKLERLSQESWVNRVADIINLKILVMDKRSSSNVLAFFCSTVKEELMVIS